MAIISSTGDYTFQHDVGVDSLTLYAPKLMMYSLPVSLDANFKDDIVLTPKSLCISGPKSRLTFVTKEVQGGENLTQVIVQYWG